MAKVLILDQSKSMRNTLRERLEYEGFSTEAAEDEEAASNMCEKIPFDVILSDTGCKIPDKGVPFIVLSSEASGSVLLHYLIRYSSYNYHFLLHSYYLSSHLLQYLSVLKKLRSEDLLHIRKNSF